MPKPSAIVIGVGAQAGLGAALCRRFAVGGHHVFVVGRTEARIFNVARLIQLGGGSAEPIVADATSKHDVAGIFEHAFSERNRDIEGPDLVVFNIGANLPVDFLSLEPSDFEAFWRVGCFAGFLVGQEAARRMLPNHKGTILFTGASGSLRGKPKHAHFAAAKAGLRMVSQSMAREFGPQGLHVAHILIDGGIDGDVLRSRWPDIVAQRGNDGLLKTDAIAENYWNLYRQDPSTWSQEIDLRPFQEYY
jgi:NAD(P)-dependent dehydrogenase (short-subunit alcohol dehydrogenase family)